jgi:hypothetical protein
MLRDLFQALNKLIERMFHKIALDQVLSIDVNSVNSILIISFEAEMLLNDSLENQENIKKPSVTRAVEYTGGAKN